MADDKKNPLGPTGEQVKGNVERIRTARGMTKKDLSDRAGEFGRPIPPLGVSRIESGTRRVDADDLVALALALNVSPLALLLPPEWSDVRIPLTPDFDLEARTAWLWAEGRAPASNYGVSPSAIAVEPDSDDDTDEASDAYWRMRQEYEALSHPAGRRRAAQHPANNAADSVSAMVGRLVRAIQGGKKDAMERQLAITKNRLAQLQNEVEQIELELDD
ncbi:helix-turn-helix domain-containing protein [Streptomyces sp. NBC_01142]|uniref:helix-turn-helix domain-containing protein n=1 Tax=Streptomyces sp. NBC_01142 TaxID=2975865 RepID=UPI0022513589|nr:helix-turn-helix transcriptional regulator [Streptomyces sp. NBC_01142]MCX4824894.1 helix-turn-helix domain-containing protein [Streptomyces sp. NBC_01142]